MFFYWSLLLWWSKLWTVAISESPFIEKLMSNKNCLVSFSTDHVIIYRSNTAWLWVQETTEHYEGKSLPSIRVRCSCRQDKSWSAQIACNLNWQAKVRCLELAISWEKACCDIINSVENVTVFWENLSWGI